MTDSEAVAAAIDSICKALIANIQQAPLYRISDRDLIFLLGQLCGCLTTKIEYLSGKTSEDSGTSLQWPIKEKDDKKPWDSTDSMSSEY